jgi:hypothetical protein
MFGGFSTVGVVSRILVFLVLPDFSTTEIADHSCSTKKAGEALHNHRVGISKYWSCIIFALC